MAGFAHGYRFKPTNLELLRYLEAFVLGKPLNHTCDFITVENLYGGKEPSEIFGAGGKHVRYYFTPLRRKCEHGSRFLRGVGNGATWKGQDAGQAIYDKTKTVMGFKKSLKYESNKRSRRATGGDVWLMKEYSLSDDYLQGKEIVHVDFVLCRIKKVSRKTSRNQSARNIREDETLGIYGWPENEANTLLSPPPLENSTMDEEVLKIGVEDSTMDDLDEDLRVLIYS